MNSHREPRPVTVGRYRYSKWRWRILARVFDVFGTAGIWIWRRFRPPRQVASPRKILLVQLDHLGDAVLTSPMFERLASAFPRACIDVLASPSNREVFEADPHIRRVHVAARNWFERGRGRWAMVSAVWALSRALRSEGYDLGIDVRGDVLTVIVLALAGIPRRVGWAMGGGGFLLTDVAAWVSGRNEVASRMALLETLEIDVNEPVRTLVHVSDHDRLIVGRMIHEAWPQPLSRTSSIAHAHTRRRTTYAPRRPNGRLPDTRSDEADRVHVDRFAPGAPLLVVHLGAGTMAKRWPIGHWHELIVRFLEDGWRIIIIGGSDDTSSGSSLLPHEQLRDWTGRLTVTETTALLERADLFVGSDSGPSHLAAAAGTPSVVLFSGTNRHAQWRPWSRRSLVLRHRVGCSPCHHKACPLVDHPCMSELKPDRVHRAARRWWSRIHRTEPFDAAD